MGHLMGEALAIRAYEPRDVVALGRYTHLVKDLEPRLDACLDRVDQCPVEIEDESKRIFELLERIQRRPRTKTNAITTMIAMAASTMAMSRSLDDPPAPSAGGALGAGVATLSPTLKT
jgi:hypothetical protein